MDNRNIKIFLKAKINILLVLCIFCMIFTGCDSNTVTLGGNNNSVKPNYVRDDGTVRLYDIEMTIASKNDNHVYSAKYPFYYYRLDQDLHRCSITDYATKRTNCIAEEDFNIFAEYIAARWDETKPVNPTFAYSITLSYYDGDGKVEHLYYAGYNDFPDELNVLIDKFNELCEEKIFDYPNHIVNLSPDFLYDEYGLTEADYPKADVANMIDYSRLTFKEVTASTGSLDKYMSNYYHSLEADKITDIVPTELKPVVDVSDEDYDSFVSEFINAIGNNWEISDKSDQVGLTKLVNADTNQYMYIGKAITLEEYEYSFEHGNAVIGLDAHMEDMTVLTEFIYNQTGEFILIGYESCQDFVEITNTFYNLK